MNALQTSPLADPIPTPTDETAETATPGAPANRAPSAGLLADAVAAGRVKLYRQRSNGSTRRIAYLAPDSPAREVAEYLALRVDEGISVAVLAIDTDLSRPTIRRTLAALEWAEEIEDGEWDDMYADDVDALFVFGSDDEAGEEL